MSKTVLIIVLSASCLIYFTVHANNKMGDESDIVVNSQVAEQVIELVEQLKTSHPNAELTLVVNGQRFMIQASYSKKGSHQRSDQSRLSFLKANILESVLKSKLAIGKSVIRIIEEMRIALNLCLSLFSDLLSLHLFGIESVRGDMQRC